MGRRSRQAGTVPRRLVADRRRAVLPAVGGRRGVAESDHAPRGRPVSVGEARLQRVRRLHRRLEPLAVQHPEHDQRRPAADAVSGIHLRTSRRRRDVAELGDRAGGGNHHHWTGGDHGGRSAGRQVGPHRRRHADAGHLRDDHRRAVAERRARDARGIPSAADRRAGAVDPEPEPDRQDGLRRLRRIRIRRHPRR